LRLPDAVVMMDLDFEGDLCRERAFAEQEAAIRLPGRVRVRRADRDGPVRGLDRDVNTGRRVAAGILGVLGAALPAIAVAQATSALSSAARLHATALPSPVFTAPHRADGFMLVEMPAATDSAATMLRRPRHALRLRSDMAESAMRSLGLDASECAMLFRMHSRAEGTTLVLKPQMHLNCRF